MGPESGLSYADWEINLADDPDAEFILDGIKHGFNIIDPKVKLIPTEMKNNRSVHDNFDKVQEQIVKEITEGNYVITDKKPIIVSPLGVILKEGGGVRLIHDCSRPVGRAVNDYCVATDKQSFNSVDDAAALVSPGSYMAKVDLKAAYRSVAISASSQKATGLKWITKDGKPIYLYDRKLCFGSRLAPSIFHRLTMAVQRMMSKRGYSVVAYLDDFFITALTEQRCREALDTLIALLRGLGFAVNWNKVIDPCQCLIFLGIEIDSVAMCLRLPHDKLVSIRAELNEMAERGRASKRQLQRLAGRLNWAAGVVAGGRVFLRRIIDAICSMTNKWDRQRLAGPLKEDIKWWQDCMHLFNGRACFLQQEFRTVVYTDACLIAGGAYFRGDWAYTMWEADVPAATEMSINNKELFAVLLATERWAPAWSNCVVTIRSDNVTTVSSINKGSSRNWRAMKAIRRLFPLPVIYNFKLKASHIPGRRNHIADTISRIHEPRQLIHLEALLSKGLGDLMCHMSHRSLYLLQEKLGSAMTNCADWMKGWPYYGQRHLHRARNKLM